MRWNLFGNRNAEAGPSKLPRVTGEASSGATIESAPPVNRYESTLHDEEQYQALQYPTFEDVPGCMRLFDEFMMCYALIPQLRNVYRHGELRDCTWKFQDFKYCLSLKSESEEVRRQLWIKRKAEWWAQRRLGASSEDVWDRRSVPLENFPPLEPEEIPTDPSSTPA